jgi:hypothetical protein
VATRISLRREHLVAASLVGSVVVVLGFASGLGIHHTTSAAAAPPATGGTPPPPATDSGGDQPNGGGQPADYVGAPVGNPYVVATTAAVPVQTVVTTPSTATPTTTTTTTGVPTTSGAACSPGLLPQVVDTLTVGVQGLPLLGPVVSGIGLPPLVNTLLGSCPATTTTPTPTTTR